MAGRLQHRRGTTVEIAGFTGAVAEIIVDTTLWTLSVHNGSDVGGIYLARVSDLDALEASIPTMIDDAITALNLGDAAFKDTGTGAGDVAAGDHGHSDATGSVAGFMSAADKTKLDTVSAGAEVNAVDSVNGATGVVVLDYDDVGAAQAVHGHDNATAGTDGFMSAADKTKLDTVESGAEVNAVDSVNGATGVVVLDYDDVGASPSGHNHDADYLQLSGGTMTGRIGITPHDYGSVGTNTTIFASNGNIQKILITANITLTLDHSFVPGNKILLLVTIDGTPRTINWSGVSTWFTDGGVAPTSFNASETYALIFIGGTSVGSFGAIV